MSLPQGQVNFVKCPSYPHSVGWGKGRAFDLVVKIQLYWTTVLMSMSPPLGSNCYVITPSKDAMYPQLGEVGHIVDSRIRDFCFQTWPDYVTRLLQKHAPSLSFAINIDKTKNDCH